MLNSVVPLGAWTMMTAMTMSTSSASRRKCRFVWPLDFVQPSFRSRMHARKLASPPRLAAARPPCALASPAVRSKRGYHLPGYEG